MLFMLPTMMYGLLLTEDSWFRISFGLTGGVSLTAMAISPSNPNYIYVATRNALIATTNAGQNWALIAESPNSPINFIAVDPKDPNRVYITLGGYNASEKVFVTPDGGKTWVNYTFGLPNVPVNCIIYENGSNEGLYVGTDIGVFIRMLLKMIGNLSKMDCPM